MSLDDAVTVRSPSRAVTATPGRRVPPEVTFPEIRQTCDV
jgi:hypothetical protein